VSVPVPDQPRINAEPLVVGRDLPFWLRVEPASRAAIVDLRRAVVALPIAARVEAFTFSQLLPFNLNDRRSSRRLAGR
jgi:hypothetical protein